MAITDHFELYLPAAHEDGCASALNNNLITIDGLMYANQQAIANHMSSGTAHQAAKITASGPGGATNAQAALNYLESAKSNTGHTHPGYATTSVTDNIEERLEAVEDQIEGLDPNKVLVTSGDSDLATETKRTAHNKDFGTGATDVMPGNYAYSKAETDAKVAGINENVSGITLSGISARDQNENVRLILPQVISAITGIALSGPYTIEYIVDNTATIDWSLTTSQETLISTQNHVAVPKPVEGDSVYNSTAYVHYRVKFTNANSTSYTPWTAGSLAVDEPADFVEQVADRIIANSTAMALVGDRVATNPAAIAAISSNIASS